MVVCETFQDDQVAAACVSCMLMDMMEIVWGLEITEIPDELDEEINDFEIEGIDAAVPTAFNLCSTRIRNLEFGIIV